VGAHSSGKRFDYLFEAIAAETTDEIPVVEPRSRTRRWWPLPVVAAIVALAGAVVLIQPWSGPGEVAPGPTGTETQLVPSPIVTGVPVVGASPEPEAAPELVTPPGPEAPPEPAVQAVVEAPPVAPEPLPVAVSPPSPPPPSSTPETRAAPTPTLRSPMSVSPEPRQAFPNQHVPDNDNDGSRRGGLLGRLGL
jgi:hypothetical protein